MRKEVVKATLRCLTGCNIGEVTGLFIGRTIGLDVISTIILAVSLAFIIGYTMTIIPLLKIMPLKDAIKITLAGDTVSISAMEFSENTIAVLIPGFMMAFIFDPILYIGYAIMLTAGFFSAYPVMNWLMKKDKCGCSMVGK